MRGISRLGLLAAVLTIGSISSPLFAQQGPPDNGPGGGGNPGGGGPDGGGPGGFGGGPGGGFDPTQMRQNMLDRMKQQFGSSDEEFAALQPKIESVQTLQRQTNARGGGGPGGFGGGPGGFGGGPGGQGGG